MYNHIQDNNMFNNKSKAQNNNLIKLRVLSDLMEIYFKISEYFLLYIIFVLILSN